MGIQEYLSSIAKLSKSGIERGRAYWFDFQFLIKSILTDFVLTQNEIDKIKI